MSFNIVASWQDILLVVDNLFDPKFLEDYSKYLSSLGQGEKAPILSDNGEVNYDQGTGVWQTPADESCSKYIDFLIRSNLIPIPDKVKLSFSTKQHEMYCGAMMDPHDDHGHGIAVTTYLSSCVGGNLVVHSGKVNQNFEIEPRPNRTVILKGGNEHWVSPVISGERISIQTFIRFERIQNDV